MIFLFMSSAHFSIFKNQVIADMEAQVHKLREELIHVNSQRKQQLIELGLLREEEKQRAARDHETAVYKLKAESEKMKMELKKTHAAETEVTLEKVRYPAGFAHTTETLVWAALLPPLHLISKRW